MRCLFLRKYGLNLMAAQLPSIVSEFKAYIYMAAILFLALVSEERKSTSVKVGRSGYRCATHGNEYQCNEGFVPRGLLVRPARSRGGMFEMAVLADE